MYFFFAIVSSLSQIKPVDIGYPKLLGDGEPSQDLDLSYFPVDNITNSSIKFDVEEVETYIVYYTQMEGYVFLKSSTTIKNTYNLMIHTNVVVITKTNTNTGYVIKTKSTMVVPTFKNDYLQMGVIAGASIFICLFILAFGFCDCCLIEGLQDNQENPVFMPSQ